MTNQTKDLVQATDEEIAAVNSVVSKGGGPAIVHESERLVRAGASARDARRHLLLPVLHRLQRQIGWISNGAASYLSEVLQIPVADVFGVATFYDLLSTEQPGHALDVAYVCEDIACLMARPEQLVGPEEVDSRVVKSSACLGQCERPQAVFVQGRAKPDHVPADTDSRASSKSSVPQAGSPSLRLLRRVGVVDPASLPAYVMSDGFRALSEALKLGPQAVIDMVDDAGLVGRGGAAFPTGVKWRAVAAEDGPKHVVVNADESEPGTFKDRILIENDPFSIVEAATIAGFAVGAEKGWIYIRGEYPLAFERLTEAVEQARNAGFLGPSVIGTQFGFDIEIRRGAGAYICGEETALFNSIEGYRGEPRQKPPFPTTHGLFGLPTAINNPETLANVLPIVLNGPAAHRRVGTERSTGTKLFCVSGRVGRPGLYELPFGVKLGRLLEVAGGVQGDLQTVLLGGAAGGFVGPDQLDLSLSIEDAADAGLSLGSGVVMVFDTEVDMSAIVKRISAFFRHESCGQCVPCRVGTVRLHEHVVAATTSRRPLDLQLVDDIGRVMADASICGLGHTASSAVRSAIELGLMRRPGGHHD